MKGIKEEMRELLHLIDKGSILAFRGIGRSVGQGTTLPTELVKYTFLLHYDFSSVSA